MSDGAHNAGVVYRVKNSGVFPETILYNFCSLSGCIDGANPYADVIFDSAGNLYSTAIHGGSGGYGIAYELTPAGPPWTETVLYSFLGTPDGGNPASGLLFDASGNLYGTTLHYGAACASCGTVYELTPAGPPWTETIFQNFLGPASDGDLPFGGVTFDPPVSTTELYGATVGGGSNSVGIVYSVP